MLDQNRRPFKRPCLRTRGALHAIGVGSSVSVRDHGTGELDIYTLVLPGDADISRHQVSTLTPLGRAIYGRKAGDVVEYMAPGGLVKIRIESARGAAATDVTDLVS